ncbi:MAG: CCA tRNA nucleotidyltransferase [Hyphomicrobiaceae bacterium]
MSDGPQAVNQPRPEPGLRALATASWLRKPSTQTVLAALSLAGFEARVVGGAVRNTLLGHQVDDIDIATPAQPEAVIRIVEEAGLKAVPTGLKHGTITVVSEGDAFEVTTLREDLSTDGRHADVRFTTDWEGDASRRDFTINALYCSADGQLFDPLGGHADLIARRVRFIGKPETRIREDYLRILRFFRFFAQYGSGAIDPDGVGASVRLRRGLRRLSGERLRQELLKLVVAPRALDALQALFEAGLFGEIVPAVPRLNHLARLCGIDRAGDAALRLAVLTVSCREDADRVAKRLRLSNYELSVLQLVAASHNVLSPPDLQTVKRWMYKCDREVVVARLMATRSSSFRLLSETEWDEIFALTETWTPPEFPLRGSHALDYGAQPGPQVGTALKHVETIWIESGFAMSRDALTTALKAALKQ